MFRLRLAIDREISLKVAGSHQEAGLAFAVC
jgi:hypothetical protein